MTIKTILALVSDAEASQSTLETALQLARRCDAHIEALHVRADPLGLVPYTGEGGAGSMLGEIMEATEREGGERAAKSSEMFDSFCAERSLDVTETPIEGDGVSISWREEVGREDRVVAMRGRLFNLIVVGRPVKGAALPSLITLEAALLETGRPIVVAPPVSTPDTATRVAIAWEASPEAARAIADAIPLMEKAASVTVLEAEAGQVAAIDAQELVARLAWHGVKATVHPFDASVTELGAAFLAAAGEVNADLLIKGAYSQSRLRQLILGGRTRHILANTTIPVLLAH